MTPLYLETIENMAVLKPQDHNPKLIQENINSDEIGEKLDPNLVGIVERVTQGYFNVRVQLKIPSDPNVNVSFFTPGDNYLDSKTTIEPPLTVKLTSISASVRITFSDGSGRILSYNPFLPIK